MDFWICGLMDSWTAGHESNRSAFCWWAFPQDGRRQSPH
jgi:hypothetical protein